MAQLTAINATEDNNVIAKDQTFQLRVKERKVC